MRTSGTLNIINSKTVIFWYGRLRGPFVSEAADPMVYSAKEYCLVKKDFKY